MFIALDINGNRIHIKNSNDLNDYFCPICGEQLITKKGKIKKYHFSHTPKSICKDTWHYDNMSDWHLNWQSKFPDEFLEVVKELNGTKHRADVLIEDKKIVIEFQHSRLSFEEFNERNEFFNKLGYKVIWLFDLTLEYTYDKLVINDNNEYVFHWIRPYKTFKSLKLNKNIDIFFQLRNAIEPDELSKKNFEKFNKIETIKEKEEFLLNNNINIKELIQIIDCPGDIVKVVWVSPQEGIKYFAFDKKYDMMSEEYFLELIYTKNATQYNERKNTQSTDTIINLWKKYNKSVLIFKNINNGSYVKITKDPIEQYSKYGKVYGYLSKNNIRFDYNCEIFMFNKKVWIVE